MSEPNAIEVFQDLILRAPAGDISVIRSALVGYVSGHWQHAPEAEKSLKRNTSLDGDVIAFQRASDAVLPAAGLTLWSRPDGYEVSNIVPRETGKLGYGTYNALLREFADLIARPAAIGGGFLVEVTSDSQSLQDVSSPDVAAALRRFSGAANKSTGATHPADRKRWMHFLILAHQSGGALSTDFLTRWLVEAEGWDDESAHDLAIQYEFAQDLLQAYDDERT
ncbi:hypothetical protein HZZ13_02285 [Bradyrhizobium sp. CNPSo 4010]|uniref:Uncharacterized protein n=1 Tax=Bradyrhizobium agreste TaxID=2751811 RepID=A0ABS0PHE5_9BRAD|nr:hypothetical protein [Bradyrhizobium agreste]MBH5396627.1 hypothetical protein [Bradyrhizobium agreste]